MKDLISLVKDVLDNYYRVRNIKPGTLIPSQTVFIDLMGLYKNEMASLGYDVYNFDYEDMDEELDRLGAYELDSPIGMYLKKNDDPDDVEGYHYWSD